MPPESRRSGNDDRSRPAARNSGKKSAGSGGSRLLAPFHGVSGSGEGIRHSSPMDQELRSVFEQHLDFGALVNNDRDANAEVGMFHNVARRIAVLGRIAFSERHILPLQKALVSIDPGPDRQTPWGAARFAVARRSWGLAR